MRVRGKQLVDPRSKRSAVTDSSNQHNRQIDSTTAIHRHAYMRLRGEQLVDARSKRSAVTDLVLHVATESEPPARGRCDESQAFSPSNDALLWAQTIHYSCNGISEYGGSRQRHIILEAVRRESAHANALPKVKESIKHC
jgi:hypothetical protein